ncbi:MAG: type II secretion system F family protein [Nitrospirae bacterium]|nr:type II secretion system F family protein [Nitrospirota bacterium]
MAIAIANKKVRKNTGKEISFLKNIKSLSLKIDLRKKVSVREIVFFTTQLSLMVEIGMPLNVSLSNIARQIKNPEFKQVVTGINTDVEGGRLLSDALSKYPHLFSEIYISMVKAGESTGQLKDMLDRVVEMQEKQEKFINGIKKSLTYPAVLCSVSVAVVIFLLVFVFPRFAVMFEEIKDLLPPTTKLLIWLSGLMTSYWHLGVILTGISGWGLHAYIKSDKGRLAFHRLKLKLPLVANIYILTYLAQTMRILGFLMHSNVPLIDALKITRKTCKNIIFAEFIEKIADNVEQGKGMSFAFTEADFVPESAKQIIRTGEETQNLPKVMLRLSDYYEEEIDNRLQGISTVIEPMLLIMMGLVVGVIVISLILPIFKLSKAAH